MNKIYTIYIADDHPIFLKGLRDVINEDTTFRVDLAVKTGVELLANLRDKVPDAIVLDLDMPCKNGIETASDILDRFPGVPIVLLTAHKEQELFLKALEVGIMGYVLKDNAALDINQALLQVIAGMVYISPEMSSFLVKRRSTARAPIDRKLSLLTPSELKILSMIAAFKSTREIADELFISEKTVSNHRMNMAAKLSLTGKNSLLRFAMKEFLPGY